jgi:hypothetical protein
MYDTIISYLSKLYCCYNKKTKKYKKKVRFYDDTLYN